MLVEMFYVNPDVPTPACICQSHWFGWFQGTVTLWWAVQAANHQQSLPLTPPPRPAASRPTPPSSPTAWRPSWPPRCTSTAWPLTPWGAQENTSPCYSHLPLGALPEAPPQKAVWTTTPKCHIWALQGLKKSWLHHCRPGLTRPVLWSHDTIIIYVNSFNKWRRDGGVGVREGFIYPQQCRGLKAQSY